MAFHPLVGKEGELDTDANWVQIKARSCHNPVALWGLGHAATRHRISYNPPHCEAISVGFWTVTNSNQLPN